MRKNVIAIREWCGAADRPPCGPISVLGSKIEWEAEEDWGR